MDVDRYLSQFVTMERQRRAQQERRVDGLRTRCRSAADALTAFGASRVCLFGSLAWRQAHAASDVDLAAVGFPAESYWRALDAACRALGTDHVDLIRLEEVNADLWDRIVNEGVVLWSEE